MLRSIATRALAGGRSAPAVTPPPVTPSTPVEDELELSDGDLEQVVGGLERAYLFDAHRAVDAVGSTGGGATETLG